MGICTSCEAASADSAKLIMQDGRLEEFPFPVKASWVLQKDPTCFICNSDAMEFDGFLSAISADEELEPGQLYFALPLKRLRQPLQAEEMAALAVKASSALAQCYAAGKCGSRRKRFLPVRSVKQSRKVADVVGFGAVGLRKVKSVGGGRKKRIYKAQLTVIPE
ncbi:hypothetical protein NMG60_11008056 [Bertholletia excelsa]